MNCHVSTISIPKYALTRIMMSIAAKHQKIGHEGCNQRTEVVDISDGEDTEGESRATRLSRAASTTSTTDLARGL